MKDYDKAISDYTFAVKRSRNYSLAYYYRGEVYLSLGIKNTKKGFDNLAIENYNKSICNFNDAFKKGFADSRNRNNMIFLSRGISYSYVGEHEKAISDYTKYISLSPSPSQGEMVNSSLAYCLRGISKKYMRLDYCSDFKRSCELGDSRSPLLGDRSSCKLYDNECR